MGISFSSHYRSESDAFVDTLLQAKESITMNKFASLSCLLLVATVSSGVPVPDAQFYAAATQPYLLTRTGLAPNCHIENVPIETQNCAPQQKIICKEVTVPHQVVEYERVCKDVT